VIAGRYSLVREVGRGGMGAVWLGVDEVLDRQVALKRLGMMPGVDGADLARAEREAQLAARLDHPHVVSVFNLVVDAETDAWWLVMEYVAGTTLAQLVRDSGPLSPDDAAPLLWQAADALVAAHEAGIVHRDVKPSNILVDRRRRVKLTDFGIARVAADASLTQTGLVTGSPAYLAPEVAAGQRGDEAVDVWSLGATIYHVLAGRPPYDIGDQVLGGLYRIVNDPPPRLADAGWMAPLLAGTMEKDPALRWTMTEVRDFLTGPAGAVVRAAPHLPGASAPAEATATRSLGAVGRAGPPRGLLAGVGALALALTLVLGLVLFLGHPVQRPAAAGAAVDAPDAASTSPSGGPTTPDASPAADAEPTARGMKAFIRDYVATVSSDPDAAWQMLTPKFQRESGGLDTYRDFWSGVGQSHLLAVAADPGALAVSYRVRFDNFGTGRRPTVLDLRFDGNRYLIDGERTEGFVPAG
jgi:eukaryotic-like serine/threonine-protein kinase